MVLDELNSKFYKVQKFNVGKKQLHSERHGFIDVRETCKNGLIFTLQKKNINYTSIKNKIYGIFEKDRLRISMKYIK